LNPPITARSLWRKRGAAQHADARSNGTEEAELAARSAHDELTERTQVLGPADDDEAVADPHDL
jgi:hypothetical protein